MLTPRLTNCQDCHKIPDLLKQIDCKLAELANDAYNDVVFMLGNCIPAYEINQLLAYKRILTFKYCNPHYAGSVSVNDIAGKVIRLTAGCVSRCNEPTVCEITTCCVDVVPNPTTTTTSTSSTTTTTTSTSSTTTTTTTIYPDCRIEGCFEELTTTTTTSSTSSTTTTTTTIIVFDCIEAFDFTDPEGFPNAQTGNGTKILSNGVQLITTYNGLAPIYVPSTPGTSELCNGAYQTNQSGGQGALGMKGGSVLKMYFNPPINAIAFVSGSYGSFSKPGDVEILSITSPQEIAATEITACGAYITSQIDQNTINLSGAVINTTTSSGVTAVSPVSGNISELKLVLSPPANELAGVVLDFYVCPGPTTTSTTSTSSTSTTTTTTTTSAIPVTGNSYFTFWSDVSGSMNNTIAVTAQIASVTGVKVLVSPDVPAGSTEIQLGYGNQVNKVTVQAPSGNTTGGAYLCVVPGMEAIHPSIPAGTFVTTGSNSLTFNLVDINGNPVATTADIVQGPNGVVTFNLTDAQKTADYQNTSNLRNLLQDFYATGGTEASGNTDRATNGSDEFEARVYWCHSGEERQISMLSNKGLGGTIDGAGYFPNADSIVIMAFGDESGIGYNMDGEYPSSGPRWANRASQTNSRIVDDISSVRTFVTNIESAAGNTNIYRAKFFHPQPGPLYVFSTIKPLVSPEGLLNAGINGAAVVSSIGSVPATAYNSSTDNLINFPSASPVRFTWSADLDNSPANPEQYWYDQIRNALIDFGYGV
jgi:hypothetical protein